MSIKDNFPSVGPSLSLNFARSKTLDPRITFARSSTSGDATYMDENGLIVTAAADEPRFDHKYENGVIKSLGLLIEEQRTNLLKYSEEFGSATVYRGLVDEDQTVAPDGSLSADLFTENTETGNHIVQATDGGSFTSGVIYTYSVYLKPNGRTNIRLRAANTDTFAVESYFDLIGDGSVALGSPILGTADIQNVGNGWYRCYMTGTAGATAVTALAHYTSSGEGDGTSGIYIWGAQLEEGAFPTSYIPTTSSQATRSPDNVSMTGTNFSDWYNPSEGTLYASASILGKNIHTTGVEYPNGICKVSDTGSNLAYSRVLYFGGNIEPERVYFGNRDSITLKNLFENIDDDIQSNQYYKVCGAYINNDKQELCLNGGNIRSDETDINPPTPNQFLIGTGYNGAIADAPSGDEMYLNGHISQLTYYPRRLTNDQLQNLTK